MRLLVTIAAGAALLGACEQNMGAQMTGLCRNLAESEPEVQRMFDGQGVESEAICDCYGKTIAALPEDRRTALTEGLTDMVAERDARGLDMQGVYSLYRDGEIPVEGKSYTVDDLDETAEVLEETYDTIRETGSCPA